jgi:hypothetical protein
MNRKRPMSGPIGGAPSEVPSIHLQLDSIHDISLNSLSGASAHPNSISSSRRIPVPSPTLSSLHCLGYLSSPHKLSPSHALTMGRLVTLPEIDVLSSKGISPKL